MLTKSVPREPDDAMASAGIEALREMKISGESLDLYKIAATVWYTMVSAAPVEFIPRLTGLPLSSDIQKADLENFREAIIKMATEIKLEGGRRSFRADRYRDNRHYARANQNDAMARMLWQLSEKIVRELMQEQRR